MIQHTKQLNLRCHYLHLCIALHSNVALNY